MTGAVDSGDSSRRMPRLTPSAPGDVFGLRREVGLRARNHRRSLVGRLRLEARLPTAAPDAEDRRAPLALAPDVDADGEEQHEALDDLHDVGVRADELQAVVQERHDETTDDGPDHGADAAGDGGAADE